MNAVVRKQNAAGYSLAEVACYLFLVHRFEFQLGRLLVEGAGCSQ